MAVNKYTSIAQLLKRRIAYGDYRLKEMPSERQLAQEMGVSYLTARKAVKVLLDQDLVRRNPGGRLEVARASAPQAGTHTTQRKHRLQIAFLAPAYASPDFNLWRIAAETAAARFDASVRPVDYVHWDDPVLAETLRAFDGCFFIPAGTSVPDHVMEQLKDAGSVVALDWDLSSQGIPSLWLVPPVQAHRPLDHLVELGHQAVDCFNTQPMDSSIERRVRQWQVWRGARAIPGRMINRPVESFNDPIAMAYEAIREELRDGWRGATSVFCLTEPAAIGAIAAFHDHGMTVGRDISVCCMSEAGYARYIRPSLTTLLRPDPVKYLAVCMEWFEKGGGGWIGPLLLEPTDLELFAGDSTGPPGA